jgi:hypothetical protein
MSIPIGVAAVLFASEITKPTADKMLGSFAPIEDASTSAPYRKRRWEGVTRTVEISSLCDRTDADKIVRRVLFVCVCLTLCCLLLADVFVCDWLVVVVACLLFER